MGLLIYLLRSLKPWHKDSGRQPQLYTSVYTDTGAVYTQSCPVSAWYTTDTGHMQVEQASERNIKYPATLLLTTYNTIYDLERF